MSQVGKDARGTLVNESTGSPLLPEAAPLAFRKGLITVFSSHFPFTMLCYCEVQLQTEEKRSASCC